MVSLVALHRFRRYAMYRRSRKAFAVFEYEASVRPTLLLVGLKIFAGAVADAACVLHDPSTTAPTVNSTVRCCQIVTRRKPVNFGGAGDGLPKVM